MVAVSRGLSTASTLKLALNAREYLILTYWIILTSTRLEVKCEQLVVEEFDCKIQRRLIETAFCRP